jgi:hypothetical protein
MRFQSFFILITVRDRAFGPVHQGLGERADLGIRQATCGAAGMFPLPASGKPASSARHHLSHQSIPAFPSPVELPKAAKGRLPMNIHRVAGSALIYSPAINTSTHRRTKL